MTTGQTLKINHLAWGELTGTIHTLHKNGKTGTLKVDGHPAPIAFRANQIVA